jgi:hypothetical protein
MNIISRPINPNKVNYRQLKGSGLIKRNKLICKLPKCKPEPFPTPTSPKPYLRTKFQFKPLTVTKLPNSNKWRLGSTIYPNFNVLWVNIPQRNFIILKTPNG